MPPVLQMTAVHKGGVVIDEFVIHLSFFIFMTATRSLLLKAGLIQNLSTVSIIVTTAGVVGAVLLSGPRAIRP